MKVGQQVILKPGSLVRVQLPISRSALSWMLVRDRLSCLTGIPGLEGLLTLGRKLILTLGPPLEVPSLIQ